MTTDERQIRELVADWMAATKSGEVERVLSLVTEDVVFLTPGNSPMTKADFAKASKSQASAGMKIDGRSEIKEVQVSGDLAFMWSYLSVNVTSDQSKPIERIGHTLTILRKEAGKWLLARDANLLVPANK